LARRRIDGLHHLGLVDPCTIHGHIVAVAVRLAAATIVSVRHILQDSPLRTLRQPGLTPSLELRLGIRRPHFGRRSNIVRVERPTAKRTACITRGAGALVFLVDALLIGTTKYAVSGILTRMMEIDIAIDLHYVLRKRITTTKMRGTERSNLKFEILRLECGL